MFSGACGIQDFQEFMFICINISLFFFCCYSATCRFELLHSCKFIWIRYLRHVLCKCQKASDLHILDPYMYISLYVYISLYIYIHSIYIHIYIFIHYLYFASIKIKEAQDLEDFHTLVVERLLPLTKPTSSSWVLHHSESRWLATPKRWLRKGPW